MKFGQVQIIIAIIFVAILIAVFVVPSIIPHAHTASMSFEWIAGSTVVSGQTNQLKVWAKNTDQLHALNLKLIITPESTKYVTFTYNGIETNIINLDTVNPNEETAKRIINVIGNTDVTQAEVKITLELYQENELLDTKITSLIIKK